LTTQTAEAGPAAVTRLWNRDFASLATGNLISRLGTVIFDVVLAWWLVQATGSAVYLGYILAASYLPIAVLGPFAGVLVDRWNKKWIMVWADVVSGLAATAVAIMAAHRYVNLPLLMVCCFVIGSCTAIFKPAIRAIVPVLVGKSWLVKANSVTNNFSEATKVVGPMVAGALIASSIAGIPGALAVNAASFFVSALLQLLIRHVHVISPGPVDVLRRLREGLAYIWAQPLVRRLVLLAGAVNIFLVSFNVILPLYVTRVLHGSSGVYSAVLGAEAVGGVAITLVFLLRKEVTPRPTLLAWFILAGGVSLGAIPLVPTVAGLVSMAFAQGFFIAAFNTLLFSYIQQVVAEDFLGRVFSIVYMIAIAVMPVSYIGFGYLSEHTVRWTFLFAGLGTVLCCIPLLVGRTQVSGDVPASAE
jgi:MFS family permease